MRRERPVESLRVGSDYVLYGHLSRPAAASSITFATSIAWDSMATWLEGRTVVLVLMSFAMLFSCSGSIIRSLLATTYHAGLLRHAAAEGFASKIDPAVFGCAATNRAFSAGVRSC